MAKPKCPVCKRPGTQHGKVFRCALGHQFDANPDEGGSYHADPSKRLEMADEDEKARRDNERMAKRRPQGFRFGGRR